MPGVRAAVQRRGGARLAPLDLDPEQLREQVVEAVPPARAAKSGHESGAVGGVLQRQRGKGEPGRPSLRLPDQTLDILGREVEPETAVQEGIRLLGGESQIAGPKLEQVTVGA